MIVSLENSLEQCLENMITGLGKARKMVSYFPRLNKINSQITGQILL